MTDIAQGTLDGDTLAALPQLDPLKKYRRDWMRKNQTRYKNKTKQKILFRIAQAWNEAKPSCHICGCSHIEALTIGHPDGNGAEHRKAMRESAEAKGRRTTPRKGKAGYRKNTGGYNHARGIIKASLDEIKEWNVRVECIYCNFYEAFNGYYPEPDKRPQWPLVIGEKEARDIAEMLKGVK